MKIDPDIMENFNHNIRKAQALARAHQYLEDIFEKGGENTLGIFINIQKEMLGALGIQSIESTVADEIERRLENEDEDVLKERIKPVLKGIERQLKKLEGVFENVGLLMGEVLLEQAVVTAVTAYEVYFRDAAVNLIGNHKKIQDKFYPELKAGFGFDALKSKGHDLERAIGAAAVDKYDFADPQSVKKLFSRIMSDAPIMENDYLQRRTRNFIQLRHIIVHNSGVADEMFKMKTGNKSPVGERVELKRRSIIASIALVERTVQQMHETIRSH